MKATRYQQVADRILCLIQNGVLKEGDRIPSIRQLSRELNVSVNTIKEAYWKLEDQNYITAVPQSGFYVKKQRAYASKPKMTERGSLDPQEISLCRLFGTFQNMEGYSPESCLGIASFDPELWPMKKMARFFQNALNDHAYESFNYLMTPGSRTLREQIARYGLSCGLNLSPEEIIITNGCHESIYLALSAVCNPGDTVVLESPVYFNLLQLLAQMHLKVIEIPGSALDGMNLDTLRFVIENHPVKAVFSISNFNNPLGSVMPTRKKKRLVRMLAKFGIPLIEDDIYGDLNFDERPEACKAYDTDNNVFLCSSFSKTIAPGLRVGWIAPGKCFEAVLKLKTLLNISTASVNQIAIACFLKEGGYERHLRKLRVKLEIQVNTLRAAVLKYFPSGTRITNPRGGMLLWVELPVDIDTHLVFQEAMKENILIAPGRMFTMKGKYSNCMRLNAGVWNDRVEAAIARLGEMCVMN